MHVADEDYLRGLRKLCDQSGALLILDEIQTGVARTGRLWAYQHYGIEPDIMTLAKALANGVPIGAMLTREDIASVLIAGTHGSTFGGTPFVTSVALATMTTILDDKLLGAGHSARPISDGRAAGHPGVEPEGAGRARPRAPDRRRAVGAGRADRRCLPRVRAARAVGGERVLRLTPPLIVEERECEQALGIIKTVLGRA